MKFETLEKQLSPEASCLSRDPAAWISDVSLLDPSSPSFQDDVLYFGKPEDWERCPCRPKNAVLSGAPSSLLGASNLYVLPSSEMPGAFNRLRRFLQESGGEDFRDELESILHTTGSVNQMIDAAALRIGNCLILSDSQFRILSYSHSLLTSDPHWTVNIAQGYCSYDFVRATGELESVRKARGSRDVYEVICPQSPYRKLVYDIYRRSRRIGFLLMIDDHTPFRREQKEMLRTMGKILSGTSELYLPELMQESGERQTLLYSLLIGGSASDFAQKISSLSFPEHMFTACLFRSNPSDNRDHSLQFVKELESLFPGSVSVEFKGHLTVMIPSPCPGIPAGSLSKLKDLAIREHRYIGVSSVYDSLASFRASHAEASDACRVGRRIRPGETVFPYPDYSLYVLLDKETTTARLAEYIHPALRILEEYDRASQTSLSETLQSYVECDGKASDTAKRLYIHRNTLRYRLEKIRELTGVDPEDPEARFSLRLSFALSSYISHN